MPDDYLIVMTTWPGDADDATEFAETLVRERLAACVNVLPEMQSVYTWKGNVERNAERQIVIKTTGARLEKLEALIAALHPYEVPELLVLKAEGGGEGYLRWMRETTA